MKNLAGTFQTLVNAKSIVPEKIAGFDTSSLLSKLDDVDMSMAKKHFGLDVSKVSDADQYLAKIEAVAGDLPSINSGLDTLDAYREAAMDQLPMDKINAAVALSQINPSQVVSELQTKAMGYFDEGLKKTGLQKLAGTLCSNFQDANALYNQYLNSSYMGNLLGLAMGLGDSSLLAGLLDCNRYDTSYDSFISQALPGGIGQGGTELLGTVIGKVDLDKLPYIDNMLTQSLETDTAAGTILGDSALDSIFATTGKSITDLTDSLEFSSIYDTTHKTISIFDEETGETTTKPTQVTVVSSSAPSTLAAKSYMTDDVFNNVDVARRMTMLESEDNSMTDDQIDQTISEYFKDCPKPHVSTPTKVNASTTAQIQDVKPPQKTSNINSAGVDQIIKDNEAKKKRELDSKHVRDYLSGRNAWSKYQTDSVDTIRLQQSNSTSTVKQQQKQLLQGGI